MKKKDVKLHSTYRAKISNELTVVRIEEERPYGGWFATNIKTGRRVVIKSAAKLREEVSA
jgi:hypothetical protein